MSSKIDPQLAFLAETAAGDAAESMGELAESGFFGMETAGSRTKAGRVTAPVVQVLVQAQADAETLKAAGLEVRSEIGDVFTGTIALDNLDKLAGVTGVERIESAREMINELDLATVDTRVNLVHAGPPGRRGAGVIVGVVDTGIDYTHPAFRNQDGTSRILFIWDQRLNRTGSEVSPAGFNYGVVYSNAQINTALASANPFATVRHQVGANDHGTHVTGIAAGNGRGASATQPEFRFIGAAPEADIIVVAVGGGGAEGMATSTNALDAVNWIYQRAGTLNRPCAVNMSLGDNLGPHDGTSLLERGLDNLLGAQGRGFVKSAGNVGSARHHAGGTVPTGATVSVGFAEPAGNTTPDQLDFWYSGGSTFRCEVVDSAGNSTGLVDVGTAQTFTLAGGNTVRIDHRNNDPFNGDKRIFITITRGTATEIRSGNWEVRLRRTTSAGTGRFDGWIQRHNVFNQRPTFNAPFESNDRTISTPGTAREVITAANYVTRGAGVGSLAASSSRGPTRDGRAAPTLAAPGTNVFSASSNFGTGNPYVAMTGTSMSAPHIAGILALMLQKNPNRTQDQLRQCLVSSARSDAFTGPVPNTAWGAGKTDAEAAVNCTPPLVVGPFRTVVEPACHASVVQWRCPSKVILCAASVTVPCASRPVTCSQSVIAPCTSQVVVQCLNTVPAICSQLTVLVGCGGPSVVDGCASVPAGCGPMTVVVQPAPVVNPGPVVSPFVANPVVTTGRTEGEDNWESAANLPEAGYYEYDDSWFDKNGGYSRG